MASAVPLAARASASLEGVSSTSLRTRSFGGLILALSVNAEKAMNCVVPMVALPNHRVVLGSVLGRLTQRWDIVPTSAALDVTLECQSKPVVLFPAPGGPSLSAIKEDAVLELSLTTSATKSGIEKVARSFAVWR